MTKPYKLSCVWDRVLDLMEGEVFPEEVVYDPVRVGAVIVGCFSFLGVLFWLLWVLLVCQGGLFSKILPFFHVVFTSKTLRDFGYEGYPYQLGVFEGWIVNLGALILSMIVLSGLWRLFKK